MEILNQNPPNISELKSIFDIDETNTVYTYGANLFNPAGIQIPTDLLVHESVHAKQQEYNDTVAKMWWRKYIEDPEFRLEQEVEAYRAQYHYLKQVIKDRNRLDKHLRFICSVLSGPLYGNIIKPSEARERIIK